MTTAEKLVELKALLLITDDSQDTLLTQYLTASGAAILTYKYSYATDTIPETVDAEDEQTQIYAVIAGYSQSGNEMQISGTEGSIQRQWKYADMIHYIRANVIPYAKVI